MNIKENFFIDEETVEWISLKKSEYLSQLIIDLSVDDYGFEDFHLFDSYMTSTLDKPDEIYKSFDDNREINIFHRAYKNEVEFYQIIISLALLDDNQQRVIIPILTFVTKREDLLLKWCIGEKVLKTIRN